MLSKSSIQCPADGWSCVPSLLFTWGPNSGGGNEDNVTSFRTSHAFTATLSASNPAAVHHQSTLPLEAPGHSRASLGQSFVGSPLLSPGSWCTKFCLCPPRFYSPVLCKFWQLSGGVNGNLLKESLCHTQVCLDLGLDLIESACLINYGWRLMTLYRRRGSKPSPRKRNAKK